MATRERYARVWCKFDGKELSIGVACTVNDYERTVMCHELQRIGMHALVDFQFMDSMEWYVISEIEKRWGENVPFFVEIDDGPDEARRGVQVFQPWGLPRSEGVVKE